ncbi:MAG TPA: roadblock/LC7 domain-containing protein [Methanocella sp.]|uniref:roadblock/LC7 domain-containing protein n=1 Tax=Methanocella sp. TaxID=2052833 RepID=UPI002C58562B|nr:roadblock/LC7 domain-containing protein [Methanocella sp.]HTY90864.1 roadblock/LC7 domain-containing protein [Methanocella sp.]
MDMNSEQEKAERLKSALSRLKGSGIEASAVISRDGTLLAADTAPGEEHRIFAPMYAAMLGAAEEASSELRMGIPRRVVMEVGDKRLVAVGAGPKALVVALIRTGASYEEALAGIDRAIAEVRDALRQ